MFAQAEIIKLNNPSFEGTPHSGIDGGAKINGWQDCGVVYFSGETPPDIHLGRKAGDSSEEVYFGVEQVAADGFTFLGFVVRNNETYESVSQRLPKPLVADQCYSFSIDLSRSKTYISPYPYTTRSQSYTRPVVLRIYGGSSYCGKRELLAESEAVSNADWKKFDFEFRPTITHRYITFMAFYKVPVLIPYNGNLLVDNASDIIKIPCPDEEIVAEQLPEELDQKTKDPVISSKPIEKDPIVTKTDRKPVIDVVKDEPIAVINKELDRKTIKQGQIINLKNLYFDADSIVINPKSGPALEELATFLQRHKDVKIEIGGHTNMRPPHEFCDALSKERAKSVAQFLLDRDIPISQLEYKGYGKREPITKSKTKEANARNQRVEIKVLRVGD